MEVWTIGKIMRAKGPEEMVMKNSRSLNKPMTCTIPNVTQRTEVRLQKVGILPVLRWVDMRSRSDRAITTSEACARADKREGAGLGDEEEK